MRWFYGFKLHLVVSASGELLDFRLQSGNVADRKLVARLTRWLFGDLFGDQGYLSKTVRQELREQQGVELIRALSSNMKPQIVGLWQRLLLRKRYIIEPMNHQLRKPTIHLNRNSFLPLSNADPYTKLRFDSLSGLIFFEPLSAMRDDSSTNIADCGRRSSQWMWSRERALSTEPELIIKLTLRLEK